MLWKPCCGVSMFRNQIRRGVRAVRGGDDPVGLCRNADGIIPTYCNDTVVRAPAASSEAADKQRMRETGRKLAQFYLDHPPLATRRGRVE